MIKNSLTVVNLIRYSFHPFSWLFPVILRSMLL